MASNRRVIYRKAGGPNVIDLVESAVPEPQSHEIRVRVEATGVGFADIAARNGVVTADNGLSGSGKRFPMTPGADIVGRVDAVGRDAGRRIKVGDRVAGVTLSGGYSDYACVDPAHIVPVPDSLDAAEVVALCLNYVTASQMMHRLAAVEPGDKMLVHGGAGGVGSALLELGTLYEMTMYATVQHTQMRAVEGLGGIPIDVDAFDFVEEIHRQTDGRGVMAVFDAIGGTHIHRSLKALGDNGRLVMYGTMGQFENGKHKWLPWSAGHRFGAATVGDLYKASQALMSYDIARMRETRPSWYREDLYVLINHLATGRLKPVIAGRFPLERAREAQMAFVKAHKPGKIVLVCDKDAMPRAGRETSDTPVLQAAAE